ncbi:MAG: peptidoglycan DD-metalloendopeptidase family protein [Bacteroidales bacterium]|jgi:Membrane-bound metallopeptidase|nr:peptidoglycan DD-metalloendopeptidase family protein [Bacteroidales bacterium]MBR6864589.1 peptidoglycan DD-metalloendopeptidase family protein [Bacteroidales bacterium]
MRRFLPLILGLLLMGVTASAQDTRRQESRKAQLEKEIAAINRQLKDNARSSSRALTDLSLVRRKIAARQELIAESDREIRSLDDSMRVKQREIDRLQARHDTLSLYYDRLVRGAYKNRDSRIWYMYILSSENIGQAVRRFGYLKGLSRNMSEQGKRIQETAAELELEKERLEGLRDAARELRSQRQADVDALRTEEGESASLVSRLEKDRRKYQDELRKKNREVEALNREIAEIIRKATAKPKSGGKSTAKGGKTTSTAIDETLSKNFAANKGRLPWPVEGSVIESYGQHYHPVYKNVKLPFNNGVTLAVARGAQAKAVFDGTVSQVVVIPGYNQCVLVQHGAYFTFYCKLKSVAVKAGEKVKTGQVIGTVDTISGEDQFHFQLWKERTPQNPENWLR